MAVRVRTIAELPDRVVIRDDEALEPHLLAENVFQQPLVGVRGDAVDFVVGGHDGDGFRFAQRLFEGVEEGLAEDALGDVGRRAVHAGFGLAVANEVLQRGENVFLIAEIAVALEAADGGNAKARDEVRIFAVGFFHAAPARLAGDVDDGRECVVGAAEASLQRRHGEELLDQVGVEGGAEGDGLREAGAVGRGVAVQAFLVEHDGDSKAAILEKELLDGVGQFRHGAGFLAATGIRGAADLA